MWRYLMHVPVERLDNIYFMFSNLLVVDQLSSRRTNLSSGHPNEVFNRGHAVVSLLKLARDN
jgi:hypothetical protein